LENTDLSGASLLNEARTHKQQFLRQMFPARRAYAVGPEPAPTIQAIPAGQNIVGVGFGAKSTTGAMLGEELAVIVYVRRKLPKSDLPPDEIVPDRIGNYPSDVVAVGDIRPFARPVPCGVSCGHPSVTAGTLGCLVTKSSSPGTNFILSCNHVLVDPNKPHKGDNILEPGTTDGGVSPIATLTDFEPLNLGAGQPANHYDAAIAEVTKSADVTPDIKIIGRVGSNPMPAVLYQSVRKHGRTTGHTLGVVMDVAADFTMNYGAQPAQYEDQIAIVGAGGFFSQPGDSGALVVDGVSRRPVGLLFCGGGNTTFASPIDLVLSRFGIQIL
jgi:hypothetical protein